MRTFSVVTAVLSAVLLAAHFLRSGNLVIVGVVLLSPLVLLIPHRSAVRALQLLLVFGFVEWMRTSWILASMREASGMPWTRMMLILSAVALFTLSSAVLLDTLARRRRVRSLNLLHHQTG